MLSFKDKAAINWIVTKIKSVTSGEVGTDWKYKIKEE